MSRKYLHVQARRDGAKRPPGHQHDGHSQEESPWKNDHPIRYPWKPPGPPQHSPHTIAPLWYREVKKWAFLLYLKIFMDWLSLMMNGKLFHNLAPAKRTNFRPYWRLFFLAERYHLLKLAWYYVDEQMIQIRRSYGNEKKRACVQIHKQMKLAYGQKDHKVKEYLYEEI